MTTTSTGSRPGNGVGSTMIILLLREVEGVLAEANHQKQGWMIWNWTCEVRVVRVDPLRLSGNESGDELTEDEALDVA